MANEHAKENFREELRSFFLNNNNADQLLDMIELSFKLIDNYCREWSDAFDKIATAVIDELNIRFIEHGVGYHFSDGVIIRKDNELTHRNIVKPALLFLSEPYLLGAQQEFLSAFEHQRSGKNKEALNDCLKAFESTMRAICDKREWKYQDNATAKPLINTVLSNGLVPAFWQSQLTTLSSLLESSVPTGRNKLSGHGQGSVPTDVSDSIVQYMLNMTASCIVYLASAERQLP